MTPPHISKLRRDARGRFLKRVRVRIKKPVVVQVRRRDQA